MTDRRLNIAIIPAAGIGARMQSDRAKQMLELAGEPVLAHTLRRFQSCDAIDRVILVLQPAMTSEILAMVSKLGFSKVTRVVGGGAERQDSVYRGLQVIDQETAGVIVVHDAVRPFVTPDQIRAVIERAESTGAALMALPATDTIKQVKSGRVQRTLDRRRIYHAQTPQAFRFQILHAAFELAYAESFMATDESQLVEHYGQRVSVVEGSSINIKITRPHDLKLAAVIHKEFFSHSS